VSAVTNDDRCISSLSLDACQLTCDSCVSEKRVVCQLLTSSAVSHCSCKVIDGAQSQHLVAVAHPSANSARSRRQVASGRLKERYEVSRESLYSFQSQVCSTHSRKRNTCFTINLLRVTGESEVVWLFLALPHVFVHNLHERFSCSIKSQLLLTVLIVMQGCNLVSSSQTTVAIGQPLLTEGTDHMMKTLRSTCLTDALTMNSRDKTWLNTQTLGLIISHTE